MSGQQILHDQRRAAIRHELKAGPGVLLEIAADNIGAAAHAADTGGQVFESLDGGETWTIIADR